MDEVLELKAVFLSLYYMLFIYILVVIYYHLYR